MGEPFKNLAWDDFRLVEAIADAKGLPGRRAAGRQPLDRFPPPTPDRGCAGRPAVRTSSSRYVTTSAGEEMVALADRLDEDITAFTRKVSGRELSPAGELRVTTNDTLLVHLLTPLFAAFLRQCPDMAGRRAEQSAAQSVETRCRCGDQGDRQPSGNAGRPPRRPHRLGALGRARISRNRDNPGRTPVRPALGLPGR